MRICHDAIRRGARPFTRREPVLYKGCLDLPDAGVVGLVGINGAGKSTLMLEMADVLVRPIRNSLADAELSEQRGIAYSPQRPTFPSWLDAAGIARMFGIEYGALELAFPGLLLNEIARTRGSALSVGQAQTLSVALALHSGAAITLLDEPFAPLDFRRRVALGRALQQRASETAGLAIVSSQSAAELLDVCNWVVVLRGGRYVFSGAIADIVGDARGEAARGLIEAHVMSYLLA